MSNEHFDASAGLMFSVRLFEKYRKNGLLQAKLHHVPGISGHCQGYVLFVEGMVTSCYVEDTNNRQYLISKQTLIDVDEKRGPFDWRLQPLPVPLSPVPPKSFLSKRKEREPHLPTPKRIALLKLEQLTGWSNSQKRLLATVYAAIDGRRTLEEITRTVPFSPRVTEELIRILLSLHVVVLMQER